MRWTEDLPSNGVDREVVKFNDCFYLSVRINVVALWEFPISKYKIL
jgi:hypothetical protein